MNILQKPRAEAQTPLVAVISYDGMTPFEFGIAEEVFNLPRPEFDFPWYRFAVIAGESQTARGRGGLAIKADAGLETLSQASIIIIPGWRDRTLRPPQKLLNALIRAHANGARLFSICSGVFVIAATGLLSGRRATTHWQHTAFLKQTYPDILVEQDVLYVDEGDIITSAGSAAGIDAAIHLVRHDFGSKVANAVARRLVMSPHRDGGQAQFISAPAVSQNSGKFGKSVSELMHHIEANIDRPLTLAGLAAHAGLSERTLLRRFREAVGMAPLSWVAQARILRARELLEDSDLPLHDIAQQCGYHSLETFRVAFKRLTGIAPAAYRQRFRQEKKPAANENPQINLQK